MVMGAINPLPIKFKTMPIEPGSAIPKPITTAADLRIEPQAGSYGSANANFPPIDARKPSIVAQELAAKTDSTPYECASNLPEGPLSIRINRLPRRIADIRIHTGPVDEAQRIGLRIPADGGIVSCRRHASKRARCQL